MKIQANYKYVIKGIDNDAYTQVITTLNNVEYELMKWCNNNLTKDYEPTK